MSKDERQPPRLWHFLLLPILYYFGAKLGVALTVMPEGMAILWLPNGFLVAALYYFRFRGFVPMAALVLAAEVAADVPTFSVTEALLFGANNLAEATIASALLLRWRFNPRFTSLADLVKFVAAGPLIAAFVAACFGGLIYTTFRGSETNYLEFLRIWWFGDALGLTIVAPLMFSWWGAAQHAPRWPKPSVVPDGLVGIGAGAALAMLIFSQDGRLFGLHVGPVLLLPFVLYVAVRFDVAATAVAVTAVALLVLGLTTADRNPFGHESARDAVIHAQEFIFVMSVLALGLAALLSQLRTTQSEIQLANIELSRRADALVRSNQDLLRAEAEVMNLNEQLEERVRIRTRELESALAQVKQLQGMLPICAWCKKVRDDQDYWHSVEEYIAQRTNARFSHAICPECLEKEFDSLPLPVS